MKIDILIATYNRAQSLRKTLTSLQEQNFPQNFQFEIIVIDNGPTPETKAVVDAFPQNSRYGRIKYVLENRRGKTHALNAGLNASDGEIVAFTDDDVSLHADWLNVIAKNFSDPNVDAITGRIIPQIELPKLSWYSDKLSTVLGNVDFSPERQPILWAAGSNMAVRRTSLDQVGKFNFCPGLINEDTLFSQKLAKHGVVIFYDPNMIVYHHFQPEKLSPAYFRRWYVLSGMAMAVINKEREVLIEKKFLNIPWWRYRWALQELLGYIRNLLTEKERFYHELQLRRFFGFCRQRWFGKSMITVAFVNTEFLPVPPVKGGAVEEWIEQTAQRLTSYDVHVFSIFDSALPLQEKKDHIHYWRFKKGIISKILLSTYKLPFKNDRSHFFFFPYSLWCAFKISGLKADIIHVHNRPHFVWILKYLNPRAKIILHTHQVSVIGEGEKWDEKFLRKVDLFLGCSRFIIEELRRRFPIESAKTAVAYNAINLPDFPALWTQEEKRALLRKNSGISNGEKLILYVGRLAENKGVHLLLAAVKQLITDAKLPVKLIISGARGYANREVTPYIQKLYDEAQAIKEHVIFTGYVPHGEILNAYLAADIVVIPSEVPEGFCLITIESMAVGVPVIASNRGGIPEIVQHGGTGRLVEPTVSGIRNELKEALTNDRSIQANVLNARLWVEENFTWDKVTRNIETIYEGLLTHA